VRVVTGFREVTRAETVRLHERRFEPIARSGIALRQPFGLTRQERAVDGLELQAEPFGVAPERFQHRGLERSVSVEDAQPGQIQF